MRQEPGQDGRVLKDRVSNWAMAAADALTAVIPQPRPDAASLAGCRIITHRGERDGVNVRENTLAAFAAARAAGVWGLETDIRWTADLEPVAIHDPDALRVFGKPVRVADVTLKELRAAVPDIPTLAELVETFGGGTHLMLEMKAERFPDAARQNDILRAHLAGLEPGRDYHLLALDPALFDVFDTVPAPFCLPVATTNPGLLSAAALAKGYGGLTGHYLLIGPGRQAVHEKAGQKIGTGFIRSQNALWREVNRGVEWIFSNEAAKLRKLVT